MENAASNTRILAALMFTDMVYEQIRNQPQLTTTPLGSFHFKNVKQPVSIYALTTAGLVVPEPRQLRGN